jgi:hypothetical protein
MMYVLPGCSFYFICSDMTSDARMSILVSIDTYHRHLDTIGINANGLKHYCSRLDTVLYIVVV